jgi:arylsulfatase A-like enzyme
VYPTLLEAIGLESPLQCFGRSLWPALSDPSISHREAVFSEIGKDERDTMIRTDSHKYALDHRGEGYMLYDLVEDPQEQRNLIGHPDMGTVEEALRDRILRFLLETPCLLE